MRRYELVIFDFDGTLADTGPLICRSFAAAVVGTEAERDAEAFHPWLGYPLERVHAFLSGEVRGFSQSVEEFMVRYKAAYQASADEATEVFEGVLPLLEAIPGRRAIASTKPTPVLHAQARKLGIDGHFHHIQGNDGFAHKPDPEILHRVWARVPAAPERTLFIGDSEMDIHAGRAAGVTTIGVTHGAHDRARLLGAGAHRVIDHFSELLAELVG